MVFNARLKSDGTLIGSVLSFPCLPTEPNQVVTLYCLHKVMVDVQYRGAGIGNVLMAKALEETDRLGADSFLTVNPTNEAAIQLYLPSTPPSPRCCLLCAGRCQPGSVLWIPS